jgi:bifunctional non-homologous end joining protein LigD
MLVASGVLPRDGAYAVEPKLDGWRVIVHIGDAVRVLTRPGRDLTASVPALQQLASVVPARTVLDGEVVAGSGRARSFYSVAPRLSERPERRREPVTFAVFDVLAYEGQKVARLPYSERRGLLDDLRLAGPCWCLVPSWRHIDLRALLAACAEHDVEGVVAKRLQSRYQPGQRTRDWIKVKTVEWRTTHAPRRQDAVVY